MSEKEIEKRLKKVEQHIIALNFLMSKLANNGKITEKDRDRALQLARTSNIKLE